MATSAEIFTPGRKTPLPGGYMGKVLRVDLTSGSMRDESLPEEPVLKQLIGGQALATYVLLKELPLETHPYSLESIFAVMTGPITGTGFTPGGVKATAVYLSPMTGYTLGRGATSGFWPVALKAAGYDGIIVTGVAPNPTYLFIDEGRASLRDASGVWGKGARETEDLLRAEVGLMDARVACIGPAGENLVNGAMLVNDYNHNAAHSAGAIMGSKKLKAIVVHGTGRPPLHDRTRLMEAGERWRAVIEQRSVEEKRTVGYAGAWGAMPKLNWRSAIIEPDDARGFEQNRITLKPCFQCPRICPWDAEIGEGPYKGTVVHFNAGSEWLDTFYNLGIKGNDVLYLAERINDLGIECSHFSCGAGVAFEAYEKGLLGQDRTEGLILEWGNTAVVDRLLDMAARREGWLGNLLADGPTELAEALGGEAHEWTVHTKGGTPAMHDWRSMPGNMLREIVASGGMKPQGGGSMAPPPDLAYREKWGPLDRTKPEGWASSHLISEAIRQFSGIIGACWFAQMAHRPEGFRSMVDSLNATTGWDFTLDQAVDAGLVSIVLQTIFGIQRGWKAEDDWTKVGPRFLEPIPDGKYQGFTIRDWLPDMVQEYYRLSGRHPISGRPFMSTLKRLGLEEFAQWGQPDESR